jgi:hypothetical protein
MLKGEEK